MPIVYETAAPAAAAASVYERLARRNFLSGAGGGGSVGGGGGGGGRGYGGNIPYDTGIQDAIQFRDTSQFAEQRQAQEFQGSFDRQQLAGEQRMAEQHQQFQLQANLQDVTLSQQERMRLQRLKNSVGEVTNDSSLSDEEKNDYIQQIKYNIDPLQRRLAQEKIETEKMQKEAMAEHQTAQAAFEKARLDGLSKSVGDNITFVPDHVQLSAIAADITKSVGPQLTGLHGPQIAQEMIGQMAQQEALKQGLGTQVYRQPDGKLVPVHDEAGSAGGKGGTGGKPAIDHPSGLSPQDYQKELDHVRSMVHREADKSITDIESGGKKFAKPELQDPAEFNKRVKELMKASGLPGDFSEYTAGRTPQQAKGQYDPSKAPWARQPAAAATEQPAAPQSPSPGIPTEEAVNKKSNEVANQILSRNDLPPEQKTKAAEAAGTIRRILVENGRDESKIKGEDKKKYEEAKNFLNSIPKPGATPVPQAPPPPQGPNPQWQPVLAPTDEQRAAGAPPTPAQAVGDLARKLYGYADNYSAPVRGFLKGRGGR